MLTEQLKVGDQYTKLKKSIVIFITNYNLLKRNSYHSVGRMLEVGMLKPLTQNQKKAVFTVVAIDC